MVSIALLSDMESKPYCEEDPDAAVESTEVKEAMSELPNRDSPTEQPSEEQEELSKSEQPETESIAGENKSSEIKSSCDPECNDTETECKQQGKLRKTNSWKMVRFQDPSEDDDVSERDSSVECLFPQFVMQEWTSLTFEELFMAEDWQDITEDRLLRKKVLEPGPPQALSPTWGQEVTVKMQSVLEDRTVVEKDCNLVFVIGEGDVTQALEECVLSMQKGEITLLLADSQYAYGLLGREPDIPAWAPLLSQLQLLDIREKPDPLTLPIPDRFRIGNQKREQGNFHFQREEYSMAATSYAMALDMLTTCSRGNPTSALHLYVENISTCSAGPGMCQRR